MHFFLLIAFLGALLAPGQFAWGHGGEIESPDVYLPTQIGLPQEHTGHSSQEHQTVLKDARTRADIAASGATVQKQEEFRSLVRYAILSVVLFGMFLLFFPFRHMPKMIGLLPGRLQNFFVSSEEKTQEIEGEISVMAGKTGVRRRIVLLVRKYKPQLQHASLLLGGLLPVVFVILLFSGVILSFFYDPTPQGAHESVGAIVASGGTAFIRNLHFWAADAFLFILFLHFTRVALSKPSGRARRIAWLFGIVLFLTVSAEMLAGTFMRGDQEAYEAYSHFFLGTSGIVATYFPPAQILVDFFSGNAALFRFFIIHSVLIPLTIALFFLMHALFAPTVRSLLLPFKKITDATIRGSLKTEGLMRAPTVKKLAIMTLLISLVLLVLSFFYDAPFLTSPYAGLEVTKPPWWLLWIVALENKWGLIAIIFAPVVLFGAFAAIPFFSKDKPGADLGTYIYIIAVVLVLLLGFWGVLRPQVAHTEHFMQEQGEAGSAH